MITIKSLAHSFDPKMRASTTGVHCTCISFVSHGAKYQLTLKSTELFSMLSVILCEWLSEWEWLAYCYCYCLFCFVLFLFVVGLVSGVIKLLLQLVQTSLDSSV